MSNFLKNTHSELLKLMSAKSTLIVMALVLFLQTGLAFISAKQILAVGLNATPETNSSLAEAIPPIEYLGFDAIMLGLMPMIIIGALFGANEYNKHSMRTTLLATSKKSTVFFTKTVVLSLFSVVLSFVSIFAAIAITHVALGSEGLNPLFLSSLVWKQIMLSTFSWTALTVLAFVMGFLFKTAIVPLLFLIPQVYNLGNLLAEKSEFGKYLPVALGNGLIATSPSALTDTPINNILFLLLWIAMIGTAAYIRFYRCDLGGKY